MLFDVVRKQFAVNIKLVADNGKLLCSANTAV